MLFTYITRRVLKFRRFRRAMESDGYELVNLDIHSADERYTSAKISPCGNHVFLKKIKVPPEDLVGKILAG